LAGWSVGRSRRSAWQPEPPAAGGWSPGCRSAARAGRSSPRAPTN